MYTEFKIRITGWNINEQFVEVENIKESAKSYNMLDRRMKCIKWGKYIYIYRLFNIFENAQNQIFALIISLNKRCPFKIYERFQMQNWWQETASTTDITHKDSCKYKQLNHYWKSHIAENMFEIFFSPLFLHILFPQHKNCTHFYVFVYF